MVCVLFQHKLFVVALYSINLICIELEWQYLNIFLFCVLQRVYMINKTICQILLLTFCFTSFKRTFYRRDKQAPTKSLPQTSLHTLFPSNYFSELIAHPLLLTHSCKLPAQVIKACRGMVGVVLGLNQLCRCVLFGEMMVCRCWDSMSFPLGEL